MPPHSPHPPVPGRLRLGLSLGYDAIGADAVALARQAETLGYSVAWAAEAYGSDAVSVLAWVAAHTSRIDVGSAVLQIPARSPAMAAMTAASLDALSGGRFRLGLGVSGPQVSEGWHGVRFTAPLQRTREYLDIVRLALRAEPVRYAGTHFTLPLPDGPGKALRLSLRPVPQPIPVYLAAIGPQSLELTGELAEGWLAIFFSPEHASGALDRLRAGRIRAGRTHQPMTGFDVAPTVPVVVHDDLEQAALPVRAYTALYLGGMGSKKHNFYNALAARMGFQAQAAKVQSLFLDGRHRAAAAAVPQELIDTTALIGPGARIRDRLHAYAEAGVTTLNVAAMAPSLEERLAALRTVTQALDESGLAA